ncbi:MAG: Bifunctional protein hldE [Parcubacteria group bacterium Gr01-1014_48]|nr:MAG: Bifunctional protein hldE [Parcubacteria group bacterium Greene0416_14]TSC73216.1 MAG: Bifunctional protein hldE [Parcubacteria group bacterium Gr01-1014_48]TSD00480.1 MAG: Bifunctional protein hldE [Parcubacteria group bacterium Greene1014_15]TSD08385.1 MAG: Bifunctional protein hldE [Parcubacteria group bacterium Greene0714_4]
MESFGAQILSLDEFKKIRDTLRGTIVATSGGFDPIHPGHISCIIESKKYGDILVVAVNGDNFLRLKKGKPFQDIATRASIVSSIRGIDYVIPFDADKDDISACVAIEGIRPHIFTKGGDRDFASLPTDEQRLFLKYNIKLITNVGADKRWSSSTFLKEWSMFSNKPI